METKNNTYTTEAPQKNELELIDSEAEKAGLNRTRFVVECAKFWKENHK